MRSLASVAIIVLIGACRPAENSADTTTLAAVDTLKPATDTPRVVGSTTKIDTATTAQKSTRTKAKTPNPNMGRDSVIIPDFNDPKRQLPVKDTVP